MSVDILNRWTRAVLWHSETATTIAEAVTQARDAKADLRGAYLRGAYLRGADLRGADLRGADLRGAYLREAEGLTPRRICGLLTLLDQPGEIIAYKLVTADWVGPYNGGLQYEIGKSYEIVNASTDVALDCGPGINVAMCDWICREWRPGYHILTVSFRASDIAAIPTASDGKFRLHRCKVVGEIDPTTWGLAPAPEAP